MICQFPDSGGRSLEVSQGTVLRELHDVGLGTSVAQYC